MSRIGKLAIDIPEGVKVVLDGKKVIVSGPKGELFYLLKKEVKVDQNEKTLSVITAKNTKNTGSIYGLTRTILANMVKGVHEGFEKQLEFHGVGFRAAIESGNLVMHLGFSHPVEYTPREGIEIKVEKNIITVSGFDKQLVGQTAAEIRELKKPEPYKGKGIKYVGEKIRRKAGKAAAKAAA